MTAREWVPGDVAIVVNVLGEEKVARFATHLSRGPRWVFSDGSELLADEVKNARPLVMLDIADLDWLPTRLRLDADALGGVTAVKMRAIADDIEAQIEPPRPPEVYLHFSEAMARGVGAGTTLALCGKVWKPTDDVTVVGRCPECAAAADAGWVA